MSSVSWLTPGGVIVSITFGTLLGFNAQIGLSASARALRNAVARLPRP